MDKRDIYATKGYSRLQDYERNLTKLEKSTMDTESKQIIHRWHNNLFAKGCSKLRIAKLTYQIIKVYDLLENKPLSTIVREDIELYASKIAQVDKWSDETRRDYRRCLKQFYLWYEDIDPRIEKGDLTAIKLYRYLKKNFPLNQVYKQINPADIISEGDLSILLEKGCFNSRDRAFIAVLHESGCRIGEMLNIRITDVVDNCTKIYVDGKTGKRTIPLKIISPAYLQKWLLDHPHKDSNSFLWICQNQSKSGEPLNYHGAKKMIARAVTRAEITKKHNVHWFRHSRASINAEFMTEQMMCLFFGWTIGSKQVRTYTHANSSQVESVLNRHYGLEEKTNLNQPIRCHKCQNMNIADSQFCSLCGTPLTTKAFETREKYETLASDLLQKIMKDDKLKEKFMNM